MVQDCTNTATATPLNQIASFSATVQQGIKFAIIPLFQYAVFYNMDMEINPGNTMVINGHVHSNNAIYATGSGSTTPLTFNGNVDASGGYASTRKTNFDGTDTRTGNVVFTTNSIAGTAVPNQPSLTMPIGTNNDPVSVRALLGIPPSSLAVPSSAGYSTNGTPYLYNSSDLIISNAASGTNITIYYNNQNVAGGLTKIDPDVVQTNKTGSITNSYYSFVTNVTFYDYRESDTVKATQIDVAKLNTWLANTSSRGGSQYNDKNAYGATSKGHVINSVYVFNSATLSSTQLPAVRLGQRLETTFRRADSFHRPAALCSRRLQHHHRRR